MAIQYIVLSRIDSVYKLYKKYVDIVKMTFQTPDKLINYFKNINLDRFHVLDIFVGELDKDDALNKHYMWLANMVFNNQSEEISNESPFLKRYPFKSKPISLGGDFVNTSNYKGYTATYVLSEKGNLILEYYGFGKYDITQIQIDEIRVDLKVDFPDKNSDGVSDKEIVEMILDEMGGYNSVQNTPELIQGDFWMCARESIYGPKTYIPFKNSVIISDEKKWIIK